MTKKQLGMFGAGEDLPLFSGTPQPVKDSTFTPKDEPQQGKLYTCPVCKDTGFYRIVPSVFVHRCEYCKAGIGDS